MAKGKGFVSAFWAWLWDKVIEHWPTLAIASGGGLMTYLASASNWVSQYGPVAWGAIGLLAALVLAIVFWLGGIARTKFAMARYAEKQSDASSINPLAQSFERQRIRLADFFHPLYHPTTGARFQGCELFGPAHVLIRASVITHSTFLECEVVIVKKTAKIVGATAFVDCVFNDCKFMRISIYMVKEEFEHMKKAAGWMPEVISDGNAGDL